MGRSRSFTSGSATRAGTWLQQGSGRDAFRAFVPKPLPPDPPLVISAGMQRKLEAAGLALGRLDGIGRLLPGPDELLYSYVRKEAVLSSQIEGTQSSLADLLLHEHEAAPGVPLADVQSVSNYVNALNQGVERLKTLPLSLRMIKEIHATLVSGSRGGNQAAGDFRRIQNWIGGPRPAEAMFVPPPANEVPAALSALEKFIHTDAVPRLVKAGLVHAQFETIHPFLDGNGRVGRILIPLLLVAEGALERPWLYVSLHFKRHRSRYYDLLQRVRTHGDWEAWIDFYLDGVAAVADEAVATVRELLMLFDRDRQRVSAARGGSIYQSVARQSNLDVYDHLRRNVAISIPETATATGLSKPTVARALRDLTGLGITREVTGRGRSRVFVYTQYLAVLNHGEAAR